jgi:hydroxymethylpyrimidine pyrophosphatase-like HAD family hydrolase
MSSSTKNKKVIVFDLDGTLAESKSPLTQSMSSLLVKLLEKYYVSIISGGAFPQFKKQIIDTFNIGWKGNVKARYHSEKFENKYRVRAEGETIFRAQHETYNYYKSIT